MAKQNVNHKARRSTEKDANQNLVLAKIKITVVYLKKQ